MRNQLLKIRTWGLKGMWNHLSLTSITTTNRLQAAGSWVLQNYVLSMTFCQLHASEPKKKWKKVSPLGWGLGVLSCHDTCNTTRPEQVPGNNTWWQSQSPSPPCSWPGCLHSARQQTAVKEVWGSWTGGPSFLLLYNCETTSSYFSVHEIIMQP